MDNSSIIYLCSLFLFRLKKKLLLLQIDLDTKSKRRWASKKLRDKLLSGNDVSMTNYMYFELPRPDDHKFHAIGEVGMDNAQFGTWNLYFSSLFLPC